MQSPPAAVAPRRHGRPIGLLAVLPLLLLVLPVQLGAAARVGADEPPTPTAPPAPPPAPAAVPPAGPPPASPPAAAPQAAPEEPKAPAGDVITLDNGNVVNGTIVEEDAQQVVVQTVSESGGGARLTLPRARISTIRRGGPGGTEGPTTTVVKDTWCLLRSGGETVGTRHTVLRSLRRGGQGQFRIEQVTVQLPQGLRIPRTRIERVEDCDLRFLPQRMTYHEAVESSEDEASEVRFERSVSGTVEGGVWRSAWRKGAASGRTEAPIVGEARGVLGVREWLLRDDRKPGLAHLAVLDAAKDELTAVQVGWTALGGGAGRPDELQWVEGGERRIARFQGNDLLEESLADGLTAVPTDEATAKAVERASRAQAADPAQREVSLPEQALVLTLPGPDWIATRAVPSGFDAGWRMVARLSSSALLADARVEWNPEGTPRGQTPAEAEAALLVRLRVACKDLSVFEARTPVAGLPGAWRLGVRGTLRDTAVRTLVLCVPRGAGQVVVLAACPDSGWEAGRPSLERLLASARGL